MDIWKEVAQWGWTIICLGLGWWTKMLFDEHREVSRNLVTLATELPKEYVRKEDLRPILDNIQSTLERIEMKVDGKADKSR